VFCCFNNNYKITPEVFDIWMRLLREAGDSVLWLLEDNAAASRNLRLEAARRGVLATRLVFAPRIDHARHLARHLLADLFVDTLPYNAHTTACDALWTGLPLVTCMGGTFPGRVAGSLLHAAGLPDLITHSLPTTKRWPCSSRARRSCSPSSGNARAQPPDVCLVRRGALRRNIESAYVTMWERCQRGEPTGELHGTGDLGPRPRLHKSFLFL
jgi:predicted O-linked N-acetylglucosamine transferase (SPINDLY family)